MRGGKEPELGKPELQSVIWWVRKQEGKVENCSSQGSLWLSRAAGAHDIVLLLSCTCGRDFVVCWGIGAAKLPQSVLGNNSQTSTSMKTGPVQEQQNKNTTGLIKLSLQHPCCYLRNVVKCEVFCVSERHCSAAKAQFWTMLSNMRIRKTAC